MKLLIAGLLLLTLAGCDNLAKGTRIKPLQESNFFADGQSSRPPPPHSIAQGQLHADALLYTGQEEDGKDATRFPWPINEAALARGRVEYGIVCANCHGADGYGKGMIVRRGFPAPPSLHLPRLRAAPVGHYFDVITHGYGVMYPYASIIDVNDRWAIIAYIRALQRSQQASRADVPPQELARLEK